MARVAFLVLRILWRHCLHIKSLACVFRLSRFYLRPRHLVSLCISKLTHLQPSRSRSCHHPSPIPFLFLISCSTKPLATLSHLPSHSQSPNRGFFTHKYLRPGLTNPLVVPHIATHALRTRHEQALCCLNSKQNSPSSPRRPKPQPTLLFNNTHQQLSSDPAENGRP